MVAIAVQEAKISNSEEEMFPISKLETLEEILTIARKWLEDPTFKHLRQWKQKTGTPLVGTFPVYVPKELMESFGILPVSIQGGGEFLELTTAEAYLGSFICSISKSTLELALRGELNEFSGFISPYICDVSRNLAGVFERNFSWMKCHMLHYPQNVKSKGAVKFLMAEYKRIIKKLEDITGQSYKSESLREQIIISNRVQDKINSLMRLRIEHPGCIRLDELYLILRLGSQLPNSVFLEVLKKVETLVKQSKRRKKDFIPVLVMGPFCEQPTLEVIQLIEEVGFYVTDFDFQIGQRFITERIDEEGDPLEALARAYVKHAVHLPTRHNPNGRKKEILERLEKSKSKAVIFLTAKFCEPALEDYVLYKEALEKETSGIPHVHIEFEERSSNYEAVRLQLETLFESLLFE